MNLLAVFITGLTVGGLTCLAVQGGLLASVIASKEQTKLSSNWKNVFYITIAFLAAKFIAHTLLGFILGMFGGAISISDNVQVIMQLLAGIYMVAIALNMLNVHPIFRYAIIQPPRFLTKLVKDQSKSQDIFAPAILGAMTIFIPCGTTLAMEVLALSSANAFLGAAIMAIFILGTIPLFLGLGVITSALGGLFKGNFLKIAAIAVIYLGLTSINGALVAMDSPLSFQKIVENAPSNASSKVSSNEEINQNIEIFITSNGYSPNYIKAKKGSLLTIKLTNNGSYSCASAFRIPSLGISKNVRVNESQIIEITPQQSGKIPFSCSMGMYRGVIEVI